MVLGLSNQPLSFFQDLLSQLLSIVDFMLSWSFLTGPVSHWLVIEEKSDFPLPVSFGFTCFPFPSPDFFIYSLIPTIIVKYTHDECVPCTVLARMN